MMALLLSKLADAIGECQRCPKIWKGKRPLEMVLIHDTPPRKARPVSLQLATFERRHASAARYASQRRKVGWGAGRAGHSFRYQ
jgi:hypothetical protein